MPKPLGSFVIERCWYWKFGEERCFWYVSRCTDYAVSKDGHTDHDVVHWQNINDRNSLVCSCHNVLDVARAWHVGARYRKEKVFWNHDLGGWNNSTLWTGCKRRRWGGERRGVVWRRGQATESGGTTFWSVSPEPAISIQKMTLRVRLRTTAKEPLSG